MIRAALILSGLFLFSAEGYSYSTYCSLEGGDAVGYVCGSISGGGSGGISQFDEDGDVVDSDERVVVVVNISGCKEVMSVGADRDAKICSFYIDVD